MLNNSKTRPVARPAQVDASTSLQQLLYEADWSETWQEAELRSCLRYARGVKGLSIPKEWADVDAALRGRIPVS